jgi:hypothetical protein
MREDDRRENERREETGEKRVDAECQKKKDSRKRERR